MGRFASTADFYEQARPPYGRGFFEAVARRLGLDGSERLLDLGTGPGLLALGFAPWVGDLIGVDPEPAMLASARRSAARAGVSMRLIEGRTEDLPGDVGPVDLVTVGRALHWMAPGATRAVLDSVVAPGGAVLICRASAVSDGRNAWREAYEVARTRWRRSPSPPRQGREPSAVFAGTRFRFRESIAQTFEHEVGLETLVDRVLSMSTTSPDRIGAEIGALRDAVGTALAPFARDGLLVEVVEARADVFAAEAGATGSSGPAALLRSEPARGAGRGAAPSPTRVPQRRS